MLYKPKVANIFFPSTNRFLDVQRALEVVGIEGVLVPWNTKDYQRLRECDGYIIAGGFAYEDIVRAGVIAAGSPILYVVKEETERTRKPWIGICNGFQIQVESGVLPGIEGYRLEMGLAPNAGERDGEIVRTGFDSDWYFLMASAPSGRNCMTYLFKEGDVIGCPIAHGEGRVAMSREVANTMGENKQIAFRFCSREGQVSYDVSVNPNGSPYNITGVSNPKGNVAGMMPHAESSSFVMQLPESMFPEKLAAWGDSVKMEGPGPGRKVFESLYAYLRDI